MFVSPDAVTPAHCNTDAWGEGRGSRAFHATRLVMCVEDVDVCSRGQVWCCGQRYDNAFVSRRMLSGVPLTRLPVPTARIQYGSTALMNAAAKGHLEVADLLIRNGAQVQHENKVIRGNG